MNQSRLKFAIEDLVRPHFYEGPEDRIRDVAVLVKDLAEFSEDVAGWAVREWRLNHDRRPTSAALRQLCMVRRAALVREQERRTPQLPPPSALPGMLADEAEIAKRAAFMAGLMKGMPRG